MFRKLHIYIGIVLMGLFLTACNKDESKVAFPGDETSTDQAGTPDTTMDVEAAEAEDINGAGSNNTEPDKSALTGLEPTNSASTKAEQANSGPSNSKPTPTTNSESKTPNTTLSEGDSMGAISDDTTKEFYYEELSKEMIDRITGKSYQKNDKVSYDDLRYVSVLHWGFDDKSHRGELIVNKTIAQDIVEIFRELYDRKYPIERMVLVDEYDADDEASMADNNTSAFNYRVIAGTDRLSNHSYGLAIDINPLYNPYVTTRAGKKVITPENGKKYADRTRKNQYYIDEDDPAYKTFTDRGFTWGGAWTSSKDYQHFQKEPD